MAKITEILKKDELWDYLQCRKREKLLDYMVPVVKADDGVSLLVTTGFDEEGILLSLEDSECVIDHAVCHTRDDVVSAYEQFVLLMTA